MGRKVLTTQLSFWTEGEQFMIDKIDSDIKLTKTVVLLPRQVCKASGIAKLPCLSK